MFPYIEKISAVSKKILLSKLKTLKNVRVHKTTTRFITANPERQVKTVSLYSIRKIRYKINFNIKKDLVAS